MLFLVVVATLALGSLPTPSACQGENTTLPLTLPARVISTSQQAVCPPNEMREMVRDMTVQDIRKMIGNTVIPTLRLCGAQTQTSPAASCSALPTYCPSEYYWLRSSDGTAVQVYCDMDRVCGCSGTRGWICVANLNMSIPSQQCPGEWILQTYSSEPRRLCGRGSSSAGCLKAIYSTHGISYNHVCGRLIGYGYGSPDAFSQHIGSQTLEGHYLDGISLTHGPPGTRQHIWSFAAGLSEIARNQFACPCVGGRAAPSYVGNDYFCESGNHATSWTTQTLYTSDPLWDGQGCGSPPCCEFSSPPGVTAPWFCKLLPQATTDDIEVRICGNEPTSNEDTPVELIELYIR